MAKLTETEVREIRALYSAGAGQRTIARQLNITPSTVHLIVRRKLWRHIE